MKTQKKFNEQTIKDKFGKSISIVTDKDEKYINEIQEYIGYKINEIEKIFPCRHHVLAIDAGLKGLEVLLHKFGRSKFANCRDAFLFAAEKGLPAYRPPQQDQVGEYGVAHFSGNPGAIDAVPFTISC